MANLWIICLCVPTAKTQKEEKSNPAPPQTTNPKKKETKSLASQPALVSTPIMLPLNFPANTAAPNLTTVTPQPVIVNNQVLFCDGMFFLPIVICLACVKVCCVIIYVFGFVSPPGLHSHNPTVNNQPWPNCISWVALPCRDFICNCTRWFLAISASHYFMPLVIEVDVMDYSVFQLDNRRLSSMPPRCYLELSTGLRSSRSATTS